MTPSPPDGSDLDARAGTQPLCVELERLDDDRLCVRVAGELDLATTEELTSQITATMNRTQSVVLDLSGVTFMDSTGLAAILAAATEAADRGAALQIASPLPAQPQRLFELTGVLDRLAFTAAPPRPPA